MFSFFKKKSKNSQTETATTDNKQVKLEENFNNVDSLAEYFRSETGITFENQKTILKSKLKSFCQIHQINSFEQCLRLIQSKADLKQELINYLTTNESYFYREFHQIQDLVNKTKVTAHSVDILCAPCSTGEEVYSIVIALLEAGVSKNQFTILGIDINNDALERAKAGAYNERNVSKLPKSIVEKYFRYDNFKYHIDIQIKQCVNLKQYNIFSPGFKNLGKFDFILSRNMLIYFDKQTKQKAQDIFETMKKNNSQAVYYGHADLY